MEGWYGKEEGRGGWQQGKVDAAKYSHCIPPQFKLVNLSKVVVRGLTQLPARVLNLRTHALWSTRHACSEVQLSGEM